MPSVRLQLASSRTRWATCRLYRTSPPESLCSASSLASPHLARGHFAAAAPLRYLTRQSSIGVTAHAHLKYIWRINRSSLKILVRHNVHSDSNRRGQALGAPALPKGKAMTMLNTTPRYAAPPIRRGVAVFLARLGRLVNRLIAAAIAHRERQANLVVLRHFSDRDLKDIGIYRCEVGDTLEERAQARQRIQRTQRS